MTTQALATSTARPQWTRTVLYADALVSDLAGVALVVGSGTLATHLGISSSVAIAVGISFFVYAIGVFMVARRGPTAQNMVMVGVLNTVYVVGVELLLLSNALPMTAEGKGLVIATNLIVGLFAVLDFIGARQLRNS